MSGDPVVFRCDGCQMWSSGAADRAPKQKPEGSFPVKRAFGPPVAEMTGGTMSPIGEKHMLWTIFVILLVLWLLGVVTSYTFGGFIHILVVIALVVLVINLIQGRRAI